MRRISMQALFIFCVVLLPGLARGALTGPLNEGLGEVPPGVERRTPYGAVKGFTDAVHRGQYSLAAHYLDLREVAAAEQSRRGAELAQRLKYVLDRALPGAVAVANKEPEGDGVDPVYDELGRLELEGQWRAVRLERVEGAWVFDAATVQAIDGLYEEYGPVLGAALPQSFFARSVLGLDLWQWLGLAVVLAVAVVLALMLERVSLAVGARLARWTVVVWDDALVEAGRGPLRLPYFALLLWVGCSALLLPPVVSYGVQRLVTTLLIVSVAWFILRALRVSAHYVHEQMTREGAEEKRARELRTQLSVLSSVFEAATYVVAAALLLMQFETVRNVGVSLLASAGIAGLVLGLAAQKSISSLLAGIQLSMTQPIRLGDTVVVQNEWGKVEEITLTYVVVQVWDERRLVVPISEFLDKPFQNWSKGGNHMVGEVILQVDYTTEVEALRRELQRVVQEEGQGLWDGRVANVAVVDVLDRTLKVRVLVSAAPAQLFDLRCLARERLVAFLCSRPEWLPATRTEARPPMQSAAEPSPAAASAASAAAPPVLPRA